MANDAVDARADELMVRENGVADEERRPGPDRPKEQSVAAEDDDRTSHERDQRGARGRAPGGSCEDAGRRAEQKRLDPRHEFRPAEAERPELLPAQ